MDADLRDLLMAWLGGEDPGEERRDALLERLRTDAAFRQAFVDEIRLLGMLKAVQTSHPRWLRLEDVIGWSAPTLVPDETLAERVVRRGLDRSKKERRGLARFWALARWLFTAGALAAGFTALVFFRPQPPAPPVSDRAPTAAVELARVVRLENVEWETGQNPLAEGGAVTAGRLRISSGRLSLVFGGVSVTVVGPADLELKNRDRVFCRLGKIRVLVPPGAEGFTVNATGYEVVDLGTEFGLNVGSDGKSQLMVFRGEATVSVLDRDQRSRGSVLIEKHRAVEIDPGAKRIRDVAARPGDFVDRAEPALPALDLAPIYAAEVLKAEPWGYWRFEKLVDRQVYNEVAGGPPLRTLGGVQLTPALGKNRSAVFGAGDFTQALLMDGLWAPPREVGYAIELWVQAAAFRPDLYSQTALVSLIAADGGPEENHVSLVELSARSSQAPHDPFAVRFLDRWPAARAGGTNVFSRRTVVPTVWHHVVGQKAGDTLELYIDGELVGTSPAPRNANGIGSTECQLLVGRLKLQPRNELVEIRPFEGRIDELAVYGRPLTAQEIRAHALLGN
jgi:hypothetical protein